MISTVSQLKLTFSVRNPLRIAIMVMAAVILADSTLLASGPRSRSTESRTPSGWTGIDLRQRSTQAADEESDADDTFIGDPGPAPSDAYTTGFAEPPAQDSLTPFSSVIEAETEEQPTWHLLPPRERRSRSYNTLKPPAPVNSPLKVEPPASRDPRNRGITADRPRNAPSIREFEQVLADLRQKREAEEAEEEKDKTDEYDNNSTRPRSRSDRTASSETTSPLESIQTFRDRLLHQNILDETEPVAQRLANTRGDQLFFSEPLSTVRLNEILYYLESGDSANVIRLAPGAHSNPYFNPPASSEFQRSRAVYEQVFRSDVQTR